MARLANFHMDAGSKFGGDAEPGAKNFQDERIARTDEFDAAAQTNTQCFQAFCVLVVGRNAAHHGADVRRQGIQADEGN